MALVLAFMHIYIYIFIFIEEFDRFLLVENQLPDFRRIFFMLTNHLLQLFSKGAKLTLSVPAMHS